MEETEENCNMSNHHIAFWDKIVTENKYSRTLPYIGHIYKVGDTNTDVELGVCYIEDEKYFALILLETDLIIWRFTQSKSYEIILKHLTKC